jgi:ribosomal protein S18 acetylase RimI-like enzyme
MPTPALKPGWTLRPARPDDASAVLDVLQAISLTVIGSVDDTLDDLLADWSSPSIELNRDTRVVVDASGRIAGYGIVLDGLAEVQHIDVYAHPDHWDEAQPLEAVLLDWAEARTRENLAVVPPDVRVAIRAYTYSTDTWYQARLHDAGLRPIRHAFRMEIDLDDPPPAVFPEGIRLRVATVDEDWRPILAAIRDAWRDHWGYIEQPFETHYARWLSRWQDQFTPGLWLLAVEDEAIAGLCLCKPDHHDDQTYGWIATLAVPRAYRRRGIARALLQQSFHVLHQMGRTKAGLGVDASSLTGATRLYEQAGMRVHLRFDLYEKELRPGIDTTTQEVEE